MLRWVPRAKQPHRVYGMEENGQEVLRMELDARHAAHCASPAGAFLLEREGFWRTRIRVRDAAGAAVGRAHLERWSSESFLVELGGTRYRMRFRNKPMAELTLSAEPGAPLVTLRFFPCAQTGIEVAEAPALRERPERAVLLALAWYVFLPAARESVLAFAT